MSSLNPTRVFLIRAAASFAGSGLITWLFFGRLDLGLAALVGAVILAAAYGSEAVRRKRKP
jgi:NhaP-type Na+/H+ or K+/H+ antiporter